MPDVKDKFQKRQEVKKCIAHFYPIEEVKTLLIDLGAQSLRLEHKMDRLVTHLKESKQLAAVFIWVTCRSFSKVNEAARRHMNPVLRRLESELNGKDFEFLLKTLCNYGNSSRRFVGNSVGKVFTAYKAGSCSGKGKKAKPSPIPAKRN